MIFVRSEQDIIKNILDTAEADEDIKAVIRTNLVPVREYLYNYDFYFIVGDISKYDDDIVFEKAFGERILRRQELPGYVPGYKGTSYGYAGGYYRFCECDG